MSINVKKVTVLGLGTLGAQIALQASASGYLVTAFDPDSAVFQKSIESFKGAKKAENASSKIDITLWKDEVSKIKILPTLSQAVENADLVIEAVPENLELKRSVWKEIGQAATEHTILATNSSSMPVSKLESAARHPEMCLNIHFYHLTMGMNMADIMGGTKTSGEVILAGENFVKSLGVVPLMVKKELLGFCFNRVWRSIKREALYMHGGDFVDFQDIDRAWMIFSGTPWGPFGLMDAVGLDVVWDIEMMYYLESKDAKDHPPQAFRDMIDAGNLGVKSGRGFYTYPNPEFMSDQFLNP